MRYTRIYTDAGGETHFEEAEVPLRPLAYAPPAPPYLLAAPEPATALVMATLPRGWFGDWHPSPRLQYWFQLAGELEVRVSDGDTRVFVPGSIVRVEDTTGKGHTTRVLGEADVCAVYVQLPEE